MNLRRYQDAVLKGSICINESDRFVENTLGLVGEAGEFADQVKKEIRDGSRRSDLMIQELGDVLWYLTSLAGQLGFDIEELASLNYQKLHARHPATYPDIVE